MEETSDKWNPPTFEVLPNAISLPASESGVSRSDLQAGPMTDLFGREVAPVPASPVRAKAQGLMTLVTSGRLGKDSSQSEALQRSLESSLMKQLDSAGSTLFKLIWKGKRTPLGRRYLEQQALAHRTPVYGCTSVPTPNAMEGGQTSRGGKRKGELLMGGITQLASVHTPNLDDCNNTTRASGQFGSLTRDVNLASVPTPMAGTPAQKGYNAAGNNDYSRKIVELASVSTPRRLSDPKSGHNYTENMTGCSLPMDATLATVATPRAEDSEQTGAHRGTPDTLNSQASLAFVASSSARDWKDSSGMSETGVDPDGSIRSRLDQLPRQAQLADSGGTATGGTAKMKSTGQLDQESRRSSPGQLNAGYSRWLMGLPPIFDHCAIWAMRNLKQRKRES